MSGLHDEFRKEFARNITEAKRAKRAKVLRVLPKSKLEGMCDPNGRPWLADKITLVGRILAQWDENIEDEVTAYIRNMIA